MFAIEKREYGFLLTFDGFIDAKEMQQWFDQSEDVLADAPSSFGVLVDMRTLIPLHADAQEVMQNGQRLYREAGMKRSAVILNHPVTTIQFQRLAQLSGIYEWERYIDASRRPNWEEVGLAWLEDGVDPDQPSH